MVMSNERQIALFHYFGTIKEICVATHCAQNFCAATRFWCQLFMSLTVEMCEQKMCSDKREMCRSKKCEKIRKNRVQIASLS